MHIFLLTRGFPDNCSSEWYFQIKRGSYHTRILLWHVGTWRQGCAKCVHQLWHILTLSVAVRKSYWDLSSYCYWKYETRHTHTHKGEVIKRKLAFFFWDCAADDTPGPRPFLWEWTVLMLTVQRERDWEWEEICLWPPQTRGGKAKEIKVIWMHPLSQGYKQTHTATAACFDSHFYTAASEAQSHCYCSILKHHLIFDGIFCCVIHTWDTDCEHLSHRPF